MPTTREDLSQWFDEGVTRGATHMIVVCDTFGYEDYPVYVMSGQDVREKRDEYNGKEMQSVMEVYALHLNKESQLSERRAFHYETSTGPEPAHLNIWDILERQ